MKTPSKLNPLKPLRTGKLAPEFSELPPLGMDADALALDIRRYFGTFLGRDKYCRSSHYPYQALVLAPRDRLMVALEIHALRLRGGRRPARLLPLARIPDGAHAEQRPA